MVVADITDRGQVERMVGQGHANQHRQRFGIGLTVERVTLLLQQLLEGGVVFDDAVVDDRDAYGVVGVRMRIHLSRRTMRRASAPAS